MKKAKVTSSYWAKLKDPRWQKKRLEVMEYNDFACEHCGDTESTLNVHHKAYKKKADPWEYDIEQLACLCETCHEEAHRIRAMVDEELYKFRTDPNCDEIVLLSYLRAKRQDGPFPVMCDSYEEAEGIADAWRRDLEGWEGESKTERLIVDLAMRSKDHGAGHEVWRNVYQWLAAPDVVIQRFERLLNDAKYLAMFEEMGSDCLPKEVLDRLIAEAKAKQALSTSVGDSIKEG